MDWIGDVFSTWDSVSDTLTAIGFLVTFIAIAVFGLVSLFKR